MPAPPVRPALTYALRQLVWGIQSEVAVVTNLSQLIDAQVTALNLLRAEVAARLVRLDGLRAAAGDADLGVFLDQAIVCELPVVPELFPARIYA